MYIHIYTPHPIPLRSPQNPPIWPQVSEANCLPPDGLRRALSSVYLANGRFKAGALGDPKMTIPGGQGEDQWRDLWISG